MSEVIIQDVLIDSRAELIFQELISWGEAKWWPKSSLMRFVNLSGKVQEGTVYLQIVRLPFGPKWHTRNEAVDNDNFYIKRVFLDGIFSGFEELKILQLEEKKCKILYSFNYSFNFKVRGVVNRLMWKIFFRQAHISNIDKILYFLKSYLEGKLC